VENRRCISDSTCIPVYEQFFCCAVQIDEFRVASFLNNCLQRATDIYWRLILHCTEDGYLPLNFLYSTSYTNWFITLWKECQRIDIIHEMNDSFQAVWCFPPVTWMQWFWTLPAPFCIGLILYSLQQLGQCLQGIHLQIYKVILQDLKYVIIIVGLVFLLDTYEVKKTFSEYVHPLNKRFQIFWVLLKVLRVCLSPLMIDILRCISYVHIHDEYVANWLL